MREFPNIVLILTRFLAITKKCTARIIKTVNLDVFFCGSFSNYIVGTNVTGTGSCVISAASVGVSFTNAVNCGCSKI